MSSDPAEATAAATAATPLLVVTAHPGDFVWRAAGAIALGLASETWAEAYQRAYPHVTTTLA